MSEVFDKSVRDFTTLNELVKQKVRITLERNNPSIGFSINYPKQGKIEK